MESYLIVDLVLVSILVLVGLIQSRVGFFQQLGSITGHVLGLIMSLLTAKHLIVFVESRLTVFVHPLIVSLLIFEGLYIFYFFTIKWVGYKCSEGISGTKVEIFDKILGFLIGVLICFCILVLVTWLVDKQTYFQVKSYYNESKIYHYCLQPATKIVSNLPSLIKKTIFR